MKKILLATTILGMSAGFAAAQISTSVSGGAGFAQNGKGADVLSYSFAKIGVTGSAETDSGLTFSVTSDLTAGVEVETGGDIKDGRKALGSGAFGMPTIAIGGSFGKISFKTNGFDFFDDANKNGDVKYEGTFGALTAGVITDIDASQYSVKLGYSANNITLSADTDSYDIYNVSAGYTFGSITATLSTDEKEVTKVKAAYDANGIKASLKVGDNDTWEATAGYTAGPLSVEALVDDTEYTRVTGSYDLGNNLSILAGANTNDQAYLGAAMKF